jgi:tRNA (mo5U34)-methyltransferase
MERRGASVVAMDRAPFEGTKIQTAIQCLSSTVEYRSGNVYYLNPREWGYFDIVLFLGVFYHLRNPMLALDSIRSVMKCGNLLYLNTLVLDDFLTSFDGRTSKLREEAPHLLETPFWQYYPGASLNDDYTNYFVPNMAAVRAALHDTNFECERDLGLGMGGFFRAKATFDKTIDEWAKNDISK